MRFYLNLSSLVTQFGVGSSVQVGNDDSLPMQCGGKIAFEVVLCKGGNFGSTVVALPSESQLRVVAVQGNDPTTHVWDKLGFDLDDSDPTNPLYTADVQTGTTEFLALFSADSTARSVPLILQFAYRLTSADNWVAFSSVNVDAFRAYGSDVTGTPTSVDTVDDYEPAATASNRFLQNGSAVTYSDSRSKYGRDNLSLPLNFAVFVESAGHYTWTAVSKRNIAHTMTGAFTLDVPTTAPFAGASGIFLITQDGTGGRVLTLGSGWVKVTAGDLIDTTASALTVLMWDYDGTTYHIARHSSTSASLRKAIGQNWQTISSFSSAPDASLGLNMEATIASNVTLSVPTGAPSDGAHGLIVIKQDATGGRIVTLGSGWVQTYNGNVVNQTANAKTVLSWQRVPGLGLYLISRLDRAASVATADMDDSAVTTAKINDAAITTAKINDGAITNAKIASGTIARDKIAALPKQVLTTDSTQSASTADNDAITLVIPANTLSVGDIIEFKLAGFTNNSTTASNFISWLKYNGTKSTGVSFAMGTTIASGVDFLSFGCFVVRAIGSSGTLALQHETQWKTTRTLASVRVVFHCVSC